MSTADSAPAPNPSPVRAYAQLLRLPNVFTALADVAMGFLVAGGTPGDWPALLTLGVASAGLYLAGMVLNDWFDAELDARERPSRPIPSGRISLAAAGRLGWTLLAAGVAAGWLAGLIAGRVAPGLVATGLAALVVAYDGWFKPTPLAPLAMGGCRLLNVLLGMSAAAAAPWLPYQWLVAGGIGLYIAGVTWFARTEATDSGRSQLALGTLAMLVGIGLVAWYPSWRAPLDPQLDPTPERWDLFWLVVAAMVVWRCVRAIADPRPLVVQAAVKNCILSLIVIDAGATLATAGTLPAVAIMALIVPAVILGQWIYST